jgi:hypothetical protein
MHGVTPFAAKGVSPQPMVFTLAAAVDEFPLRVAEFVVEQVFLDSAPEFRSWE